MTTKLEGPLRRELSIGDERYTLTITPTGLSLVPKGRRKGFALDWLAFINGDAALAIALNASLANGPSTKAHRPENKPPAPLSLVRTTRSKSQRKGPRSQ